MKKGLLLIILLYGFNVLRAEINVSNSLEWLCARADLIVKGTITSVNMKDDDYICSFEITERFKGSLSKTSMDFTMPSGKIFLDKIKKIMIENKEVIIFFSKPDKNQKDIKTEYVSMKDEGSGLFYILDPENPGNNLISAFDFKLVKTGKDVILKCKNAIELYNKYLSDHKRYELKKYLLEIPFQTEAYGLLYSGSSCYLYVPDCLFPNSKKGFH